MPWDCAQARKQLQQPSSRGPVQHVLQRPSGGGKLSGSEWARMQVRKGCCEHVRA